jgi:hypothetical protein
MSQNVVREYKEQLERLFEEQKEIFNKTRELGFSKYAHLSHSLSNYFELRDIYVRCIDDGTPGGIHLAGSGILREKRELTRIFKENGVSGITSHDGCSAALLYAQRNGLDETESDKIAKKWSETIARELGIDHRHIDFSEMQRPRDFHIARVVYYDGTGKFDYKDGQFFPPGFIISRNIQNALSALEETNLGMAISFGKYGFGKLISSAHPFSLIAIGNDEEETTALKKELRGIKHGHENKVIIDGFTAPNRLR